MRKSLFALVILFTIQIINCKYVLAENNIYIQDYLFAREKQWPEWNLSNYNSSNLKKDLIYPKWFEGDWLVTAIDLNNTIQESIVYKVNFTKNDFGEIIANRKKNSESIGKEIYGDRFLKVKVDPKSFNNQIVYLGNEEYIESRITGRTQIFDNDLFFADEFFIQTVHKPEASRINQVEVMSKFYRCEETNPKIDFSKNREICGFQYLATYGSKVGNSSVKAISTSKYKLIFTTLEN